MSPDKWGRGKYRRGWYLGSAAVVGIALVAAVAGYRQLPGLVDLRGFAPEVLVSVNGESYTRAQLAAYLGHEPRFTSTDHARVMLNEFVGSILIEQTAAQLTGRGEGPTTRQVYDHLLERFGQAGTITNDEIEQYYERERDVYVHPRKVRLAYFFGPRRGARESEWRQVRSLRVWAQLDKNPVASARLLAQSSSEVVSGEIGPVPCDGKAHGPLPAGVVEVGCTQRLEALSEAIETAEGLFLLRVTAVLPARHRPLARVRSRIRQTLEARARNEAQERAVRRLREASDVVIADDNLARLVSAEALPSGSDGTGWTDGPALPPGLGERS